MGFNWKTTLAGIIAIGLQFTSIWAPGALTPKVMQTVQAVTLGAGLVAAKDSSNEQPK